MPTGSPVSAASHEMLREKMDRVLDSLTFREREIILVDHHCGLLESHMVMVPVP